MIYNLLDSNIIYFYLYYLFDVSLYPYLYLSMKNKNPVWVRYEVPLTFPFFPISVHGRDYYWSMVTSFLFAYMNEVPFILTCSFFASLNIVKDFNAV